MPKTRRLHLIQAHSYPKEYFFAVTNKGVGGLLKRWGDGASMIRGTWKPRDNNNGQETKNKEKGNMEVDSDSDGEDDGEEDAEEEDGEDEDGEELDESVAGGEETPKAQYNNGNNARSPAISPKPPSPRQSIRPSLLSHGGVDELTQSMSSLSLVPPSIRFGRGGKGGGFMHPELHNPQVLRGSFGPRGRGRARIAANAHPRGSGHVRGFPRGTARGHVVHVQGGVKGRGSG